MSKARTTSKKRPSEIVIEFKKASKIYKLYKNDRQKLMAALLPGRKLSEKVASNELSFKIRRGESVVVLGKNGAGKSTLLKLITGITFPTSGDVFVKGQVSAILELTAGFDGDLTGRENIFLKGTILGLDKSQLINIQEEIINFAGIGEYIDQPVRMYSSGMKARLGFAINAHINPDILIIDEALSVGDKDFRRKCRNKIAEIRAREHVTTLFVTHSSENALMFGERGMVLENGQIVYDGPIAEALNIYDKRP